MPKTRYAVYACLLAISLSGCAANAPQKSGALKNTGVSSALASAASESANAGQLQDSLAFITRMYQQNPKKTENIVAYARALRRANQIDNAKVVIQSVAEGKSASLPVIVEFAHVLIAAGDFDKAVAMATKAVQKSKGNALAQQALGLALSGLGKDTEAESHFRTSLLRWPEDTDKTSIINNLAMNLAAQGKLVDAKTVMALATGEALQSDTYRNNRALLNALKTEVPLDALPAIKVEKEQLVAANKHDSGTVPTKKLTTRVKMKPIVE